MAHFYSFQEFWEHGFQGYYRFKFRMILRLALHFREIWVFDDDLMVCMMLSLFPAQFHVFNVRLVKDRVSWIEFKECESNSLKKEDLEHIKAFLHYY
ncbi:MAG: hypothetical protein ACTSYC_05145 [Promethearchaeota archaeon]